MILPEKKQAVAMILSKRLGADGESEPVEMKNEQTTVESDQPLHAIASDAIRAFESKSPTNLMHALKAFYTQMSVGE